MQILNQIGHLQHWGLSPATNLLKFNKKQKNEDTYKILLSGCSDIRHILKTICDVTEKALKTQNQIYNKIQFYIHQPNKQLLCRALLFLHIIHETNLNFQQRIQIFLDIYGNAMIKQRNAEYLHSLRQDLLNFIHDEKKVRTVLKKFVSLNLLKFQERDQCSDIVSSWSKKIPLQMEKLRDQKMRYLFKQRYDYKSNLVDWDFNMLLTEWAPVIHYYHYKQWRLTGLAYEQRFSTYTQPNRTLASYASGKKKQDKTSCLVRGYWGDIIVSPYIALGIACDYMQADLLFKKANYKYIGHSVEVAQYNLNYWLHMLENEEEYVKVFRDYYRADEETKKMLETKDQNKKKKKNDLKEIKEEDQEQIKQEQPKKRQQKQDEGLDSDEQRQKEKVSKINSKAIELSEQEKEPLSAFKRYNMKVHLMGMNSEGLIKPKYRQFFDMVVLSFVHSAYISKDIKSLVKKEGILVVEKAKYVVPKKKDERKELDIKLKELIQKTTGFKQIEEDFDFFAYQYV